MRFGLAGLTTDGADPAKGALARLVLECDPVESVSIRLPYFAIWGTTTAVFRPASGPLPTEGIEQLRVSADLMSMTGAGKAWAGYQTTNRPDDPTSWSSHTLVGGPWTTEGLHVGTSFSAVAFDERWVRVGGVFQSGTSALRAARIALRWDFR